MYLYVFSILLDAGFWRESNKTDIIEYCGNMPGNCLGGNDNFTCKTGHAGALCEGCDIKGELNNG